jgi:hypothetical protein
MWEGDILLASSDKIINDKENKDAERNEIPHQLAIGRV